MCPPQLFSKQDVPQDYAFRSYYGSDPDSFKAGVYQQPQSLGESPSCCRQSLTQTV